MARILDGNGRWAKKRGLPRQLGHKKGCETVEQIVEDAARLGIRYLTVYGFSTENWKRSAEEVGGIFGLLVKYVASELEELHHNNVKVRILGDYNQIPKTAVNSIEKALTTTKDNDGLQFSIALNYGGRQEIVRAVRQICYLVENGELKGQDIDEDLISSYLYTGMENQNIPDPDLIIRTSGEERLSNFLLWQGAYSEMAFSDSLWPDFTPDEFESIIEEYTKRERRYGGR